MIRLTVSEIAQAVNGRVVGDANLAVEAGVEIDSRLIKPGFLFVAKPGEQTDGHNFAGAAIANYFAQLVIAWISTHEDKHG